MRSGGHQQSRASANVFLCIAGMNTSSGGDQGLRATRGERSDDLGYRWRRKLLQLQHVRIGPGKGLFQIGNLDHHALFRALAMQPRDRLGGAFLAEKQSMLGEDQDGFR